MAGKELNSILFAKFFPTQNFSTYDMLLCSAQNVVYIMLNAMPITTAIMPQFIYDFIVLIITLTQLGTGLLLFFNFYLVCSAAVLLHLTYYVP